MKIGTWRQRPWLWAAAAGTVLFGVWLYDQNNTIEVTEYAVGSSRVPAGFEAFRIVQLSDLHNASFGPDNRRLLEKVAAARPDLIVLTGDMSSWNSRDTALLENLYRELAGMAPTYCILGNHEVKYGELEELQQLAARTGTHLLRNELVEIERHGDRMVLLGLDDVLEMKPEMTAALERLAQTPPEQMRVVLTHRPHTVYDDEEGRTFKLVDYGFDLALAGHMHGGQWRIPYWRGFLVPRYGFFPKYTGGVHAFDDGWLVISRGLGNGLVPQRLFNRPEVVVVTLHHEAEK